MLTVAAHEQHPTGLTDLRGARLVSTIETEAGRKLNEALVKRLTGGDPIRARRMHKDFYEFLPSHKLWFAGNHLPRIDGTDHGIWRRLALIPFHARFDNGQADKNLPAKLATEAPGILAWMVRGCLEWQQDGLQIPAAVKAATKEYRTTQDHVGRFLADACLVDEHATVTARALRAGYEAWCTEQGERPWTAQALGRELSSRGYDRTGGGRAGHNWLGLDLVDALVSRQNTIGNPLEPFRRIFATRAHVRRFTGQGFQRVPPPCDLPLRRRLLPGQAGPPPAPGRPASISSRSGVNRARWRRKADPARDNRNTNPNQKESNTMPMRPQQIIDAATRPPRPTGGGQLRYLGRSNAHLTPAEQRMMDDLAARDTPDAWMCPPSPSRHAAGPRLPRPRSAPPTSHGSTACPTTHRR